MEPDELVQEMRVVAARLAMAATELEWDARRQRALDTREALALMAQARTYLGPSVREVG